MTLKYAKNGPIAAPPPSDEDSDYVMADAGREESENVLKGKASGAKWLDDAKATLAQDEEELSGEVEQVKLRAQEKQKCFETRMEVLFPRTSPIDPAIEVEYNNIHVPSTRYMMNSAAASSARSKELIEIFVRTSLLARQPVPVIGPTWAADRARVNELVEAGRRAEQHEEKVAAYFEKEMERVVSGEVATDSEVLQQLGAWFGAGEKDDGKGDEGETALKYAQKGVKKMTKGLPFA